METIFHIWDPSVLRLTALGCVRFKAPTTIVVSNTLQRLVLVDLPHLSNNCELPGSGSGEAERVQMTAITRTTFPATPHTIGTYPFLHGTCPHIRKPPSQNRIVRGTP